jgi:hypothetical protein
LLAPLGSGPAVCAECLFADPNADIAVLGSPDNQALFDEAEAYEALLESADPFPISDAPERGQGWLLSLEGKWFGCAVDYMKFVDGPLYITHCAQPIAGGMSGSPIISAQGMAIGVVCVANDSSCGDTANGPNPRLVRDLPGWLLRGINTPYRTPLKSIDPARFSGHGSVFLNLSSKTFGENIALSPWEKILHKKLRLSPANTAGVRKRFTVGTRPGLTWTTSRWCELG